MQPALYVNAGGHLSVVRAARENELGCQLEGLLPGLFFLLAVLFRPPGPLDPPTPLNIDWG